MQIRDSFLLGAALATIFFSSARQTPAAECFAGATAPMGVATVDITPEDPVRMYGYASRKMESQGIAGRLHAKALAIGGNDGNGPAVLLTVDCGAVPADIRDHVLQRVQSKISLASKRFMLCNSHNHSGPNLKGRESFSGIQREHMDRYADQLTDRLTTVVLSALSGRRPCRLARASGSVDFAANRRVLTDGKWSGFGAVPGAPVDHSLPLLRVTDLEGKLVAIVANYACHCTTLRGDYQQIHGDWAACAQQYIEADHPGAVAMTTIGCGADSDPCPHSTVELCAKHGRAMADQVSQLLKGDFEPMDPTIVARQKHLRASFLTPPPLEELEARVGRSWALQDVLTKLKAGQSLEPVTFQVSTWTFGDDLVMVFFSDEVVVDYALRLKRELDGSRLWITAYTNDVSRYIASQRILNEGGYEARNSLSNLISLGEPQRVQPAIEERIITRVAELVPAEFKKP